MEKKQEQAVLSQLAQSVAKAMQWEYVTPNEEQETWVNRYIRKDDRKLSIGLMWNQKDRAVIHGVFENGLNQFLPYKANSPEITVAVNRGAEIISKEITRRVLPGYEAILAKAKESKARHDEHTRQVRENLSELCAIVVPHFSGVRVNDSNDRFWFKGAEVRVGSDYAELKIDSSIPDAKQLLALLVAQKKPE